MGMRVTIERTGDTTGEYGSTSAKVEFFDPDGVCTADRLGQLIGYAINGVEEFFVPGDVLSGIRETINECHSGEHNTNAPAVQAACECGCSDVVCAECGEQKTDHR